MSDLPAVQTDQMATENPPIVSAALSVIGLRPIEDVFRDLRYSPDASEAERLRGLHVSVEKTDIHKAG